MGKANLIYTINSKNPKLKKQIQLDSGSLYYLDEYTKKFNNQNNLKDNSIYTYKINELLRDNKTNNGYFSISYIRNNMMKETLPVLLDDNKIIYSDDNFYENQISEIENTRKLLHNSKHQMFLKAFLNCKKLNKTMDFNINLNYDEYKYALKNNLRPFVKDVEYYINVSELLNYVVNNNKLGKLRPVFEDSLELWKKKMKRLNEEGKYYYSRNLRILTNEYNEKTISNKVIKNLSVKDDNLAYVVLYNKRNKERIKIVNNMEQNIEPKQKILIEDKTA